MQLLAHKSNNKLSYPIKKMSDRHIRRKKGIFKTKNIIKVIIKYHSYPIKKCRVDICDGKRGFSKRIL